MAEWLPIREYAGNAVIVGIGEGVSTRPDLEFFLRLATGSVLN